ncbi:MAG: amidohydrolase family protein [Actinomycetota bacterium]
MAVDVGPKNAWRLETPGHEGWERTARPDDPNKYFMVSTDNHANEPFTFLRTYTEPEYHDRLPHVETRDDGSQFLITEGNRPSLVRPGKDWKKKGQVAQKQSFESKKDAQPYSGRMEEEDKLRNMVGRTVEDRDRDNALDGVDAELIFPNKGLLCYATPDPVFAMAMCRAWNRWALDEFGDHFDRMLPMAMVCTGDLEGTMAEIVWAKENGFKGLCLPNKPIYGVQQYGELQYNDPSFTPLWELVEDVELPLTFHVSTGKDPRAVGGNGGAIINYVVHSMETTIEPLTQLIASGVFERHPTITAGTVESGVGWVPWLLEAMDHAYRAHHFWVRPVIPELPSHYYRRHCFSTFQVDEVGLDVVEQFGLVDNFMWANDYPHHEGTWPHSAEAIERTMGGLSDESRAKILGLNAAKVFNIDIPERYGQTAD